MTSQAQAEVALPHVVGLAFLGFPLHAAGKPSDSRAEHLGKVHVPMFFLQGTRDALTDLTLLRPVVAKLGSTATLIEIAHADHSFHVLVRSGRNVAQTMTELLDAMAAWVKTVGLVEGL